MSLQGINPDSGSAMSNSKDSASENRFLSRSEHVIDEKGRLSIPARFRDVLRRVYSEKLIVTNWERSLRAYPVPVWHELENKLIEGGNKERGFGKFVRYVISGVTECPLDKQGRVLIPPSLRADLGIKKVVILNGMLKHFEIWDKTAWEAETKWTRENFHDFEEGLSNLGIF